MPRYRCVLFRGSDRTATVSRLLREIITAGTIGSVRYLSRHCIGARLRPRRAIDRPPRRAVSNPRPGPDWARQRFGPGALIPSRDEHEISLRYLLAIMNAEKSARLVASRRQPDTPDAASEDASVGAAAAAAADTKTLRPLSSLQTNVGDFN